MSRPTSPPRDLIVIGASAGGVQALSQLLGKLPAALPASILVVLHRAPEHASHLSEILARATKMKVVKAQDGELPRPGVCYLADTTQHLSVGPGPRLRLVRGHALERVAS